MYIVHVDVRVKPETVDSFIEATLENARNSRLEPGVARFDFVQSMDDPARFCLVEIYRTPEDSDKHKQTAHYLKWRDAVADMMAQPRVGTKYTNLFPTDESWHW